MSETPTMIMLVTSMGSIKVELFPDKAPASVENFLSYVQRGFYDETIFHRVIPGFMIQGGGFTADMQQKPAGAPIVNEATNGLLNKRGTLAMARTQDPNSATCQFFINLVDNAGLDHRGTSPQAFGYAVFAQVTEGMDVVDRISQVPTGTWGFHQDVPQDSIILRRIEVL